MLTPEEKRARNAAYMREWNARHPDVNYAKFRRWALANPEQRLAQQARYRARHREELRAKDAEYRASDRARALGAARQHRYRKANPPTPEQIAQQRERRKEQYHRNPDAVKARAKAWALAHPERAKERHRRWIAANRDRHSDTQARRRAQKRGNGGSHTYAEWLEKCAMFANLCAYCGEAKLLTRDHKVPLSRGGTDDITNIVPACKSCNSKKRHRTASEYLALKAA